MPKLFLMTHNITYNQFTMLFFILKYTRLFFINHPETDILGKILKREQIS